MVILVILISLLSNLSTAKTMMKKSKCGALSKNKQVVEQVKGFFKGLGEIISGGNEAFKDNFFKLLNCYNDEQKKLKLTKMEEEGRNKIRKSYKTIDWALDKIVNFVHFFFGLPRLLVKYMCKFRKNVILWIANRFSKERILKYRRMMEGGQSLSLNQLRRMQMHKGFFKSIKSLGSSIYNGVKYVGSKMMNVGKYFTSSAWKGIKYIGGKSWAIASKYIVPFLENIISYLNSVSKAIKLSFFGKDSFMGRLIECSIYLTKTVKKRVMEYWDNLVERIKRYNEIKKLGLPYIILYGFDFLFASVCDDKLAEDLVNLSGEVGKFDKNKEHEKELVSKGKIMGHITNFQINFKSDFEGVISTEMLKKFSHSERIKKLFTGRK